MDWFSVFHQCQLEIPSQFFSFFNTMLDNWYWTQSFQFFYLSAAIWKYFQQTFRYASCLAVVTGCIYLNKCVLKNCFSYLSSSLIRFQRQRLAFKSLLYFVFFYELVRLLNNNLQRGCLYPRLSWQLIVAGWNSCMTVKSTFRQRKS